MSEQLFLLTLGTTLLVFSMKYLSGGLAARSRAASENAWRDVAERAVSAQSEHAACLSAMQSELTTIASRVASIEKLLKEVE